MKGLFLYGANCTGNVWNSMKPYLSNMDITFVEYPHEITKEAESVSDITKWVYDTYKNEKFDFIVGHSMGGIIALEMVTELDYKCDKVIFIESNLKPAEEFYRNLMMENNMKIHGEEVINMIKGEAEFYNEKLKESLQNVFDYSDYVRKYTGELFGVYGDRGVREYTNRISDLCLDKDVSDKIKFSFVKDSCHMPMIENAEELSNIIKNILFKL